MVCYKMETSKRETQKYAEYIQNENGIENSKIRRTDIRMNPKIVCTIFQTFHYFLRFAWNPAQYDEQKCSLPRVKYINAPLF